MYKQTILITAVATTALACGPANNGQNDNDTTNSASNGATNGTTNATTNGASNGATNGSSNGDTNGDTNGATNGATNGQTGIEVPDFLALAATADFAAEESAWHVVTSAGGTTSKTDTKFGSGDLGVSVGEEWAYVLDRAGGQVQVLDGTDLSDAGTLDVGSDGPSNPQFATDAGGKIYVTLYDAPAIVVATPDGATGFDTVRLDTSAFDEADGNPEASAILADGQFVLVVLQRLENFMGTDNSALLVIDSSDDSFVDFDPDTEGIQPLDLGIPNAQAGMQWTPDEDIAIGATGMFGATDGEIVVVDRNDAGDYTLGESLITEEELGGDLIDFDFAGPGGGFAVISNPDFSSDLVQFETDPISTSIVMAVESPGFGGLDASDDDPTFWAIGDRGAAMGFHFAEHPPAFGPIVETSLPPAGFAFVGTAE